MMKRLVQFSPLALFLILAVFLWRGLSLNPRELASVKIGQAVPDFIVPTFQQGMRFSSAELKGQVSVINVWASWCQACLEEQPFLLTLKHIPLYGLNYKDNKREAKAWLKEWGNPYVKVLTDREGALAINLGVYGAPETFLIDKRGIIRYRHVGVLTEAVWNQEFVPLIVKYEHQ